MEHELKGAAFLEASQRIRRAERSIDRRGQRVDEPPLVRVRPTSTLAEEFMDNDESGESAAREPNSPVENDSPERENKGDIPTRTVQPSGEEDAYDGAPDEETEKETARLSDSEKAEVTEPAEQHLAVQDDVSESGGAIIEQEVPSDINEAVEGAIDAAISTIGETTKREVVSEEEPPAIAETLEKEYDAPQEDSGLPRENENGDASGTSMKVVDGVELVITMPAEEANAVFGGGIEDESPEDAMLREMQAERDAVEVEAARRDVEFDEDFDRMLNEERVKEYVLRSLRRHARWVAFQRKHSDAVKIYADKRASVVADIDESLSESYESTNGGAPAAGTALAVAGNTDLVGSEAGRRKVIQRGRQDPTIVTLELVEGESEFYGENGMRAVKEWRTLQTDYMRMQSRWDFDPEASETLLCRDKILAVEIYLISAELSLTIKRPQATEAPTIWDEFKRNEETAVRLNIRQGLIAQYKEAREFEQRDAAIRMLKNIPVSVVKAPVWAIRKVTNRNRSGAGGAL